MRIAILGGSFNPIHKGHIMLARNAYEQFDLDEVWIMPNNKVYYKSEIQTSFNERNTMIELSIKGYPYMKLSTIEQDRGGTTYTIDTMTYLYDKYPDDKFYFIIGGDSLVNLPTWREAERLINTTSILAAIRDDVDLDTVNNIICDYKIRFPQSDISIIKTSNVLVSSSYIRDNIYIDERIREYISSDVYDYIVENELYR